jgi:hypothetical protein
LIVDSSLLRCNTDRSPEMHEMVNFNMWEGWSGQPVPRLKESDRDNQRRESRSTVARWADSSNHAARSVKNAS